MKNNIIIIQLSFFVCIISAKIVFTQSYSTEKVVSSVQRTEEFLEQVKSINSQDVNVSQLLGGLDFFSNGNVNFNSVKTDEKLQKINKTELKLEAINVFPNPLKDNINLSYSLDEKLQVSITIIDLLGKTVVILFSEQIQDKGLHNFTNIPISLSPGNYFLKFNTTKKTQLIEITIH